MCLFVQCMPPASLGVFDDPQNSVSPDVRLLDNMWEGREVCACLCGDRSVCAFKPNRHNGLPNKGGLFV